MEEVICKQCKKKFEVQDYRRKTAKFCSVKCRGKFQSKNHLGNKSPKWKESSHINLICKECRQDYNEIILEVKKSR